MQKWEYLTAEGDPNQIDKVNGEHIKGPKPGVEQFLNRVGDEGWELTTSRSTYSIGFSFVFKRPIESSAKSPGEA